MRRVATGDAWSHKNCRLEIIVGVCFLWVGGCFSSRERLRRFRIAEGAIGKCGSGEAGPGRLWGRSALVPRQHKYSTTNLASDREIKLGSTKDMRVFVVRADDELIG